MKVVKNVWILEFSPKAQAQFKKLDQDIKKRMQKFFDKVIISDSLLKSHWKQLAGTHAHLYSARVGDYRIISEIRKNECKILAVNIGHRREVYKV